jgi:hypothetical protein
LPAAPRLVVLAIFKVEVVSTYPMTKCIDLLRQNGAEQLCTLP